MSQPAPKRTAMPPLPPPGSRATKPGGVALSRPRPTLLPPPAPMAARLLSLDDLGAVLEPEAELPSGIEENGGSARGVASGVFRKSGGRAADASASASAEDPSLAALADSLAPYYRHGERAELAIEDLSLRLDNPYAASSLVPPPRRPATGARRVAIGIAGSLLLAASGAALFLQLRGIAPAQSAPALRQHAPMARRPASVQPLAPQSASLAAGLQSAVTGTPTAPEPIAARTPKARAGVGRAEALRAAAGAAPATSALAPDSADLPPPAEAEAAASSAALPAPVAEAAAALPEIPSRVQVAAGFDALRGALTACAAGKHGLVEIDATVANGGRVSHALIEGAFRGSQEGSCMARAVRAAQFPPFVRPNLKVRYPIAL